SVRQVVRIRTGFKRSLTRRKYFRQEIRESTLPQKHVMATAVDPDFAGATPRPYARIGKPRIRLERRFELSSGEVEVRQTCRSILVAAGAVRSVPIRRER